MALLLASSDPTISGKMVLRNPNSSSNQSYACDIQVNEQDFVSQKYKTTAYYQFTAFKSNKVWVWHQYSFYSLNKKSHVFNPFQLWMRVHSKEIDRNMIAMVICCWESANQRPSDEFVLQ